MIPDSNEWKVPIPSKELKNIKKLFIPIILITIIQIVFISAKNNTGLWSSMFAGFQQKGYFDILESVILIYLAVIISIYVIIIAYLILFRSNQRPIKFSIKFDTVECVYGDTKESKFSLKNYKYYFKNYYMDGVVFNIYRDMSFRGLLPARLLHTSVDDSTPVSEHLSEYLQELDKDYFSIYIKRYAVRFLLGFFFISALTTFIIYKYLV